MAGLECASAYSIAQDTAICQTSTAASGTVEVTEVLALAVHAL